MKYANPLSPSIPIAQPIARQTEPADTLTALQVTSDMPSTSRINVDSSATLKTSSSQTSILKNIRTNVEQQLIPGCHIPGTQQLTMQNPKALYSSTVLSDLHHPQLQPQSHQAAKLKPLRIDLHYRGLAHIASAPNRIEQLAVNFGLSIDTWFTASMKAVSDNSKPWTLHLCPDTNRQILTLFEINRDAANEASVASRFILTGQNPAQVVTGYPILTATHWAKAGLSCLKQPLILLAAHATEALAPMQQAQFGVDRAYPRAGVAISLQTSALSKEVENMPEMLSPLALSNTDQHTLDDAEYTVLSLLSQYESELQDFEHLNTQFQTTVEQVLTGLPPKDQPTFDASSALQLFQKVYTDPTQQVLAQLKAKPMLIEHSEQQLQRSLAEFNHVIKKSAVDTTDSLASATRLTISLSALQTELKQHLQTTAQQLSLWLAAQLPYIHKIEELSKLTLQAVTAMGARFKDGAFEDNLIALIKSPQVGLDNNNVAIAQILVHQFDPRLIEPNFNLSEVRQCLKQLADPKTAEKKRILQRTKLDRLVSEPASKILIDFAHYAITTNKLVAWANRQAVIIPDAKARLAIQLPLAKVAGGLTRTNNTIAAVVRDGEQFSELQNRKAIMRLKRTTFDILSLS